MFQEMFCTTKHIFAPVQGRSVKNSLPRKEKAGSIAGGGFLRKHIVANQKTTTEGVHLEEGHLPERFRSGIAG